MSSLWRFAALSLLLFAAPALRAQQFPTPDQARRLLETRPDLGAQLRREIGNNRLTPDQMGDGLRERGLAGRDIFGRHSVFLLDIPDSIDLRDSLRVARHRMSRS